MSSLLASLGPPPEVRVPFLESSAKFFFQDDAGVSRLNPDFSPEQLAGLANTNKVLEESKSFRPGAVTTHKKLDRHLREYRRAMLIAFKQQGRQAELLTEDDNEAANDRLFFPGDLNQMYAYIAFYLTFICPALCARSPTANHRRVTLSTLASRRWSLLHWMKMNLENPPNYRSLQAKTNAALYYAAQTYGIKPSNYQKTYFGRFELQYIMDRDLESVLNFEFTESNHCALTLALCCGMRPGAIGWTDGRPHAFLRWEHISIRRDANDSRKFVLTITLPFQKGYQDLNQSMLESAGVTALELVIMPPNNPDNIPLCPTYRFLIMLLRRDLLQQYKTFQDLLQGKELYILIKPDHLEDPIFFAGVGGGYKVDRTKAASARSFSDYLRNRARDFGFPEGCTLYSFRREVGTRIDRMKGRDTARRLLHHSPDSKTYEKHYERQNYDLDVGRLAYHEEDDASGMVDDSHAVLYRAEMHLTISQQRIQIEEAVRQWSGPAAPPKTVRRYRLLAKKGLRKLAADLHKQKFTQDELRARAEALKQPSALTRAMYEHVQRKLEALAAEQHDMATKPAESRDDVDDDDDDDDDEDDDKDASDDDVPDEDMPDEEDARDIDDELFVAMDGGVAESEISGAAANVEQTDEDSVLTDLAEEGGTTQERDDRLPNLDRSAQTICDNITRARGFRQGAAFDDLPVTAKAAWVDVLLSYQQDNAWQQSSADARLLYDGLPGLVEQLQLKYQPVRHTVQTDRMSDGERASTAVPYDLALASFFELMLDQDTQTGVPKQCVECLADDTITNDDDKLKWYQPPSKLKRHVEGIVHAPYGRWARKVRNARANDGLFRCYPECGKKYEHLNKLVDHLIKQKNIIDDPTTASSPSILTAANAHHEGMLVDDWWSPVFKTGRRATIDARVTASRKKDGFKQRGTRLQLDELSVARPAVIDGRPVSYAYVGPMQADSNPALLRYPSDLLEDNTSPQTLYDDCERKGLLGKFVRFGGEAMPAPTDAWDSEGISESHEGLTRGLRKF
ncbi:hypothetical protein LTR10_011032 [Elasticomyces elasticus]|nr:hypothetical protein LTR10_011032 [Elasticomyces elasticus]KAK4968635.1 hypothetical protein LTR42_009918 [Elasticomyces elasticus]